MKIKLKQTCGACPEAYDVFLPDNTYIGYLRLRWGSFTATVDSHEDYTHPDYTRVVRYSNWDKNPVGDGMFEDSEREYFLTAGVAALHKHYLETFFETTYLEKFELEVVY